MSQQLSLGGALLPPGFAARWAELVRAHGRDVVLGDVEVTAVHVVATVGGREYVGARLDGDAKAADRMWHAIHERRHW